jgi:Tol biopolymer transport system component
VTPERWRQLTTVFHAARACEPGARAALLDRLCGQDASLRAEVEELLAAQSETSRLGDGPMPTDVLPQLSPGTTFGPYRVDALIGAGGMGQVYRATDPRLGRSVALKVLLPELSLDPESGSRFEQEARVLASLNHPNIAAIHGLEESGGVHALVLEFVEGPTLAERIARGPLPTHEALAIARQIASALEVAHERGIVHRDLKPANVKITPAGAVKVLDFGIARVMSATDGTAPTSAATRAGLVIGTPAYMSPEQARGLAVDKRTDIWAFGCVLYEMLAGRGAFAADTASDSLAKVIEREPDWTRLRSDGSSIRRLITRCLQKDPTNRLHDIADARIEIDDVLSRPERLIDGPRLAEPNRRRLVALGLVALALVIAAGWAIRHAVTPASDRPAGAPYLEFGITFPNNVIPAFGVALSPDGRYVAAGAFINSPQIWVHSFQSSETRALAGANGSFPFWSPDSSTIAYFSAGKLVTMPVAGGTATTIAEVPPSPYAGSWNTDGVMFFSAQGTVYQVPASGGTPVQVSLKGLVGTPIGTRFLPDGRHFIVFGARRGVGLIQLASLDSDQVTPLVASVAPGAFAPPDRLLFVRNTSLMAQRLDMTRFVLTGEAEVIASGVNQGSRSDVGALVLSASSNGMVALPAPRGGSQGRLTWFDRDGKPGESIEAPSDAEYLNQAISPDGAFVASNRIDPQTGNWDIWLLDLARNVPSKLTTDPATDSDPVWSPDGTEIAYVSERDGRLGVYKQSVAGGPAELLLDVSTDRAAVLSDWSANGHIILHRAAGRPWSIWALHVADRKAFRLIDDRFSPYGGRLSPDGKWLAYNSFESGPAEVFVRPFLADVPKKQISRGGGVHPRWTRGGKELVYWAPPGGILANEVTIAGSNIQVGPARTLVDRPVLTLVDGRTHYDVTRDGTRLLIRQPAGPPGPGIRVIVNWQSKLK